MPYMWLQNMCAVFVTRIVLSALTKLIDFQAGNEIPSKSMMIHNVRDSNIARIDWQSVTNSLCVFF